MPSSLASLLVLVFVVLAMFAATFLSRRTGALLAAVPAPLPPPPAPPPRRPRVAPPWEVVAEGPQGQTFRLRVPGGWVVTHSWSSESLAMCFVADPGHGWDVAGSSGDGGE